MLDTISIRGDLHKKRNLLCLICQWLYLIFLSFFIYYCLYYLHHNLFPYNFISFYWIKQSREINRTTLWFMYNPIVEAALPIWCHTKTVFSLAKIHDNTTKAYFISTDDVFLPLYLFWNWFWLDVYWNWPSDIICISFTNKDVVYFCSQNFEWTNEIIINFILGLSHVW